LLQSFQVWPLTSWLCPGTALGAPPQNPIINVKRTKMHHFMQDTQKIFREGAQPLFPSTAVNMFDVCHSTAGHNFIARSMNGRFMNGRSYVLRVFLFLLSQLTFSVCKPKFSKMFHMTWLCSKKKRCYADFIKVPPNKNEGRKPPKFRPISRLIAIYYAPSLVM